MVNRPTKLNVGVLGCRATSLQLSAWRRYGCRVTVVLFRLLFKTFLFQQSIPGITFRLRVFPLHRETTM